MLRTRLDVRNLSQITIGIMVMVVDEDLCVFVHVCVPRNLGDPKQPTATQGGSSQELGCGHTTDPVFGVFFCPGLQGARHSICQLFVDRAME